MCKVYGYARVSTPTQNIQRQIRNIIFFNPDAVIFQETYTGKAIVRPEFEKLIKRVKPGDTIIFDSVSRMSRNAEEGFKLYKELYEKGVELVFIKEQHINTETYKREIQKQVNINVTTGDGATDDFINGMIDLLNRYVLSLAERQIYLAFQQSQKEVDVLRQRTREGIETARQNGKQIGGHKPGAVLVIKKKKPVQNLILKHSRDFGGMLKDDEVMAVINTTPNLHISQVTYYKYKRELKERA